MAQGITVCVVALETELTTQQAAEILNVSRPFIVKFLNYGVLPYRLAGTHRRVMLNDVLEYNEHTQCKRREALR